VASDAAAPGALKRQKGLGAARGGVARELDAALCLNGDGGSHTASAEAPGQDSSQQALSHDEGSETTPPGRASFPHPASSLQHDKRPKASTSLPLSEAPKDEELCTARDGCSGRLTRCLGLACEELASRALQSEHGKFPTKGLLSSHLATGLSLEQRGPTENSLALEASEPSADRPLDGSDTSFMQPNPLNRLVQSPLPLNASKCFAVLPSPALGDPSADGALDASPRHAREKEQPLSLPLANSRLQLNHRVQA
jgi:hypothetical protein